MSRQSLPLTQKLGCSFPARHSPGNKELLLKEVGLRPRQNLNIKTVMHVLCHLGFRDGSDEIWNISH